MVLPFCFLRIGRYGLMNGTLFSLQAGFAEAIDTHFYVLDQARKGPLHGLGVHIEAVWF